MIICLHEGLIAGRYSKVGGLIEQEEGVIVGARLGFRTKVGGNYLRLARTVDVCGQVGDDSVQDY